MSEKDYDAAAEWAEHEMTLPASPSSLRTQEAAAFGRQLIAHSQDAQPDPTQPPARRNISGVNP
jgi:hypothetical protein